MIVISSHEDISVAVKLLKMGVADYISKDNNAIDLLWNAILKIRENKALKLGLLIEVPRLREQDNHVLVLAKFFADEFTKDNRMRSLDITPEAKIKLMQYNYPLNITKLKAIIDLACMICNGKEIGPDDIVYRTKKSHGKAIVAADKTLREHNNEIIGFYLKKYNNNVPVVADKLDIGRSTIYKMIQLKVVAMC